MSSLSLGTLSESSFSPSHNTSHSKMFFTTEHLREEEEKKFGNYIDWGTGWRHSLRATWKWTRKVSGRDCVGGREVEKIWHAWRTEQGNCRPLGRAMRERGLWSGSEKVRTNTKGGAQRYMSNQREDRDEGRGEYEWHSRVASEWMMRPQSEWSIHRPHPKLLTIYYPVAFQTIGLVSILSVLVF